MKLSYRGASYDYEPSSIEMIEGGVAGKYRGQTWKMRYPRHIPAPQPAIEMQYRGVSYLKRAGSSATTAVGQAGERVSARPISVLGTPKQSLSTWTEIHRSNLCRNVQNRLDVARQRGDQALVQMLEQELQQIACPI